MKCENCGAELEEGSKVCKTCGVPVTDAAGETKTPDQADAAENESAVETESVAETDPAHAAAGEISQSAAIPDDTPPNTGSKKGKKTAIVVAAVAAVAVVAFAAFQMTRKSPKEVVIAAFENISPEGQVSPFEELFGASEFVNTAQTENTESSMTLKMDSCSDETVNQYAGVGMRIAGKTDLTDKKASANIGLIYQDMDAANLNFYYGDRMMMAAVPELSAKVLTLDLGDELADNLKNSPTVRPLMEQNGIDVDAYASYLQELIQEGEDQASDDSKPFDMKALAARYREACKAEDNLKAALVVEKADKGTFTMDGKEVKCKGYSVTVSKDSMIEFLRSSSDFLLQDETLKKDFLKQLEMSVKMSEIMGGAAFGDIPTAEETQQQTYEDTKKNVDKMITYLDKSLTDVQMLVHVDKKGHLASVSGTTFITAENEGGTGLNVNFDWKLQGGAYLTQNMEGSVILTDSKDEANQITVNIIRQGTYDGKNLTSDVSVDYKQMPENSAVNAAYTATYYAEDGSYHAAVELGANGAQLCAVSSSGVVDQLEKGKSFHIAIDELSVGLMNNSETIMMSGEASMAPLTGEVTALEGEPMDVLAATQKDWQNLMLEGYFNFISVLGQLSPQ